MNTKNISDTLTAEEALRQSNASLTIINTISDALYHSLDFDTVVRKAAKVMDDIFHAPSVSVFMLNEKENRLDQLFASDPDIEPARLIRTLPLERGSLTALAVARREIVICCDVVKDEIMRPDVRAAIIKWGRKTILTLPLLFHDQVWGAMNLFFAEKRNFTPSELETFSSIGKTIGLALANARHVSQLEKEMAERKRAEAALRESEAKYRGIFDNAVEGIFQTTISGKVITANPALALILGYDSPEDLLGSINNLKDQLYVVPDKREEFLMRMGTEGFVKEFEFKAYRKDKTITDVCINSHKILDENGNLLYFEGVMTDVTEKKRMDYLENQTLLDGLTGIANRRRFDEYLSQMWDLATRDSSSSTLSLILKDVDHFKLFNDNYGHQKGDDCLIDIAKTLSSSLQRKIDLVARYGGEEFACILPNTTLDNAVKTAEKFRESILALQVPHAHSPTANCVSISIGVASVIPSKDKSPSVLLQAADEALYKSKVNGRNRVSSINLNK